MDETGADYTEWSKRTCLVFRALRWEVGWLLKVTDRELESNRSKRVFKILNLPQWSSLWRCLFPSPQPEVLTFNTTLSRVWLFAAPWSVACQAPLSLGFPRQEYWSGLPFPSPGDLPDSGIEPASLEFLALAGGFFTGSATWETLVN